MKNLLNISDINSNDLMEIFKYADLLTKNFDDCLIEKNVGLIFEKILLEQDFPFKLELIS